MAMIQVDVGKNFIHVVLIDGGSRVNIIIENLKLQLCLSKPNLTPYNLCMCRNPSLGFATKARGYKVASQEGSPGVMPHALGSARKCDGIDFRIPKGTPPVESWSLGGLPNVQKAIAGVKIQWIEKFFISLESY